ncbi:mycofactocin biosynthesis peptidyl-dipeptidase MftE [Streptomyces sp. CB01635]|uniref:mycofactocin biosynthesis peptidyl-dipeptidase MftE n=1 Tax=unclassified Streptomyces TaxID=2593676 RepID=UPI000C27866F|nr:mycofactocin biosynthesis peptidyl-dipeptidase MftE [Streptomyces sp. CB01635]PJN05498.1 mycofactocin biosynthesis peptidyl-dipeptidase MftE [Streptomyces sp. CB01635]
MPRQHDSSALELGRAVWPEITGRPMVLVPVGATEQHGPHLPLNTDTVVATAVAREAVQRLADRDHAEGSPDARVILAPALAFGASGEHAHFPGTVSIGHEALRVVLIETVRSLSLWAGRCVFINGHGGNVATLDGAVAQLRAEGHDIAWLGCVVHGGDAHAGRTETSLMLHLAPDDVRLDAAAAGETRPIAELMPELAARGVRAVAPNGVLGDPSGASAQEGRVLLRNLVDTAVRRIQAWRPDPRGRLGEPSAPSPPPADRRTVAEHRAPTASDRSRP